MKPGKTDSAVADFADIKYRLEESGCYFGHCVANEAVSAQAFYTSGSVAHPLREKN